MSHSVFSVSLSHSAHVSFTLSHAVSLCPTFSHSASCCLTLPYAVSLCAPLLYCLTLPHAISRGLVLSLCPPVSHSASWCLTWSQTLTLSTGLPLPHDLSLCPHSVHLCVTGLPLPHDVSLRPSLAHGVSCCLILDHDYGSSSLCLVLHLNRCCSQLVCGFTNLLGLCASLLCNKSSCGWHGASPDSIAVPDLRLLSSDRVEWRRGWRRRSAATAQLQTDMADGREQDFKFHTTERHNVHFCWKKKVVKYRWTDLKHFLCSSVERYFS